MSEPGKGSTDVINLLFRFDIKKIAEEEQIYPEGFNVGIDIRDKQGEEKPITQYVIKYLPKTNEYYYHFFNKVILD